ncbi:hypothetical protein, variant 1 [Aphanomyces invadans]|uniref:holo-[acyl-carrier-protein] synthase n=1 Tax=Aphanomyces invadans TaxID=157072 RepID=A0A024TPE8_9STRA|nr:hypothetical protein, variant 1 [Aphanomyces invadans]ETV96020.1 hypothetical protein, variant 1 [Aphanomyces invadans]|eukprot:XP_008875333.1 hypothetical protein, variant 1 [Aphanomyces invadans]
MVMRYRFPKDQKFALCSRLLQRKIVADTFHVPFPSISIVRNDHGKPSWPACPVPTWNYNVSHHGAICAIACQSDRRIGIDVVRVELPREALATFFECFDAQFGPREWKYIRGEPGDDLDQIRRFYLLWSLKEAYTKALGVGIVIDLKRQQFVIAPDTSAISLYVDGVHASTWHFKITPLDDSHYVSIAAEGAMVEEVSWKRLDASTAFQ